MLRARVGQEFDISAGTDVRRGRIVSINPDRVDFELGEIVPAAVVPSVTLMLSIFKFDRMEWAIEKCTELGVARVVPVIARRTESGLAVAAPKRLERWQRIVRQASEQSRRSAPPEISPPTKLKEVLTSTQGARIVLAESEETVMLKDVLGMGSAVEGVTLAIGPEGGWTEEELATFRLAGWQHASLGGTILRAETAAIAAIAVVLAELQ